MPYEWTRTPPEGEVLRLWPNRSLPPEGFAFVILATFALLTVPAIPLLGTPALWGLLPFLLGALLLLWVLLRRSYRDGRLLEELTLTPGRVQLVRRDPDGRQRCWVADPYQVQVRMHGQPVENYLTLAGGPREVEIGAFLSEEERLRLRRELVARLSDLRAPGG